MQRLLAPPSSLIFTLEVSHIMLAERATTRQVDNIIAGLNELFPATVRLGIFPGDQGQFAANSGVIPGSTVAGMAEVPIALCGLPGAWTNPGDFIDAAHELAHNIGFDHWACENGVTDDECGVFPIPHGGLGSVGTDILSWLVYPPGGNDSNNTPHAHDLMSYGQLCSLSQFSGVANCDLGEWVSWYTYDILRNRNYSRAG
jgi:hypothetical protein